ncbi:N-acetylmuramoyl-L-alanine amidase [Actinacidiphila acididurans]|uniref:N-acetylmuramoyl-L-alanine amidase n=1 Tax=Actinacidiphila acididurans TaxID=2784346 RepID=UPI0027DD0AA4|nr:N-acetylmuramoyl-L-alanine amidase [Actinacidiphila acididurans]
MRTWVAAGAVVAAATGAIVVLSGTQSGVVADGLVPTSVRSLDLSGSGSQRVLPERTTKPFSMVGVTWTNARSALHGSVQVRTRSAATGTWTGWEAMAPSDEIPDPAERDRHGVRGGMSPMWTGPSDGVQVRVVAAHGTAVLPAGLTVDLVDPGKPRAAAPGSGVALAGYAMDATVSPSPSDTPTDTGAPTGTPTATDGATPTDTATATPTDTGTATTAPPTTTPSATPTATPTGTVTPTATPTTTTPTPTPTTPSPTSTPWPSQLPTLAQAYPSCPGSTASPSPTPEPPSPMPAATTAKIAPPSVVTRAGWAQGTNVECQRESGYPDYGTAVKVVFVHHTDTTNNYSCADSPAIVRSILLEHLRESWRDIGYNFLVDKCGTIFEGRFGGMALPVIGAQTYGFNTNSMGIAAIGTYTDLSGGDSTASTFTGAAPTKAMEGAIARLAAWKLSMNGESPTGSAVLTEGASDSPPWKFNTAYTLNTISGHRNGFATDCPGNQLYNALPTIRSYAAGPVTGLAVTSVTGPYGALKSGTSYATGTSATVHWSTTTPAAVISGFDVMVDGKAVAHASGTATSATVTLAGGTHQVQVRATHITGSTTLSAAVTDIADITKPTFPGAPNLGVRTGGTLSSTAVPVTMTFRAADNTGVHALAATSPAAATLSATATSWATNAKPATTQVFTVKATDLAGNTATASATRTTSIVQETSTTRTGTWTRRASSSYLGGYSYSSATKNASITWTFTGRSVGWIVSRASTSGQAYVYLDGTKVSTVDLKSSSTLYRQAIWTHTWSTSAKHTLKIVVVGTSGRPTITTDGIAVLN